MDQLQSQYNELNEQVGEALERLNIKTLQAEHDKLQDRLAAPDFWQTTDNQEAQRLSKHQAELRQRIEPWLSLSDSIQEIGEFLAMKDESMADDIAHQIEVAQVAFGELKRELRFGGEHDASNVVMTIQSGAGGVDAQDWAQMLQRMYVRWADKNDMETQLLSESTGEEAGIKSASFQINGAFAYGKLKGETGVHRLVRLSPFNSAGSRETSFAMVEVVPEIDSPDDIEIDEADLRVDVFRAGGHGGQSVNTTDSAVRITHQPTGIVVSIQNERSQIQNKETAMKVLKSKLALLAEEQHQAELSKLKGPNQEAAWGNQIRSYVLQPYTLVKDGRSNFQTSDVQAVLEGDLNPLIDAYLETTISA